MPSKQLSQDPTYQSWSAMKTRCRNPWRKDWARYGGRGISYDPRWESYENFLADMGPRPEGKTLERDRNDEGYSKQNCRWASALDQAQNHGLMSNNSTKIAGVSWLTTLGQWRSTAQFDGKRRQLYAGQDFFEACCRRKSWEAQVKGE